MNTVLPCEPAGQVPIGGWSAAAAGRIRPPDSIVPPKRPALPCSRWRRDKGAFMACSNSFLVISNPSLYYVLLRHTKTSVSGTEACLQEFHSGPPCQCDFG